MGFTLNSQNVFDYLIERELCTLEEQDQGKVELKYAKNFNLLLTLPGDRTLLVKQERQDKTGKTAGEFLREWRIQEFVTRFPELGQLKAYLPDVLYFDAENSILVVNYLQDHRDLSDFYATEQQFPPELAAALGTLLATVHRLTWNQTDYQVFYTAAGSANLAELQKTQAVSAPHLFSQLERVGPEIFGLVPADALKFFALYQRYDSLGRAIASVRAAHIPSCLTHNDLKLNNVLLPKNWEQQDTTASSRSTSLLRLIDWERSGWGDPTFDVGMLIGSYLHLWLSSLVTSKTIPIEESLRMAMTPLEQLQPSIAAFMTAYLTEFPQILEYRQQFLEQVVQFTGFSLIQTIQSMIQYQKSFGNAGISMLQVAKSLLCRPAAAVPTLFGMTAAELTSLVLLPT